MLTHTDLGKGVKIILEGQPYEVLEAAPMKKAQRRVVIQARVKNIITGSVVEMSFHQGDTFDEALLEKMEAKFLYMHKNRYFFCDVKNPAHRFDLAENQIGEKAIFLKPNQITEGVIYKDNVIGINLPIKIQLKVVESPPGIKGDRAQGGTKQVKLETGAVVNAPLFVENDDIIEINSETGEYVRRVE